MISFLKPVALVALLLTLWACFYATESSAQAIDPASALAQEAAALGLYTQGHYYGWKGKKVGLSLAVDTVGLKFNRAMTASSINSILNANRMYARTPSGLAVADVAAGRLSVVKTVRGMSKANALRAILNVAQRSDIESVLPCYTMGSENLSMITDSIAVVIDSSVSEGAVLGMFVNDGLQLAERFDYPAQGKIGYRLKLSAYTRQVTGESCLAIANRYHEHPSIEQAAPVFRPLYKTMNSSHIPNDPLFKYDSATLINDFPFGEADGEVRWYWDDFLLRDAWDEVYGAGLAGILDNVDYAKYPHVVVAMLDNGAALNYTYGNVPSEVVAEEPTPASNYVLGPSFPTDLRGHPDHVDGVLDVGSNGHATSGPRNTQWINEVEANGTPGADDDGNGYVDDYYGWDFVGSDPLSNEPPQGAPAWQTDGGDNIPFPDDHANFFQPIRSHGTTTMSVIAAAVNNGIGGAGFFPTIQHMPVRFHVNLFQFPVQAGSATDLLTAGYVAKGLNYASGYVSTDASNPKTRAHVIIAMTGVEHYDPLVHMAVKQARINGLLVVGPYGGKSKDVRPGFPSSLPEVLATGASEYGDRLTVELENDALVWKQRDRKHRRANYSAIYDWQVKVYNEAHKNDIPAADPLPFVQAGLGSGYGWALDVMSIIVQHDGPITAHFKSGGYQYNTVSGTSGAAPQPAGIVGLMLTVNPLLSPMELQVILQKTALDIEYIPADFDGFPEAGQYLETASAGRDRFTGWGLMQAGINPTTGKLGAVGKAKTFKPQWVVRDDNRALQVIDGNGFPLPLGTKTLPRRNLWSADPEDGDVIFDGWVIQESTDLAATSAAQEVLFKVGTTEKARLDIGAHELHLAGKIIENAGSLDGADALFRILKPGSTTVAGIIDRAGNLKGIQNVFEINTIDDTPDRVHVWDPLGVKTLDELINDNDELDDGEIVLPGDVIEIPEGNHQLASPLNFNGKDIVLRSFDPNDRDVVRGTVLIAAEDQRTIVFDGTETEDAAVIGLTIMGDGSPNSGGIFSLGGSQNGAKARIWNNIFIMNSTSGSGGAIDNMDGQIDGNMFGMPDTPQEVPQGNTAAFNGGALHDCDGIIARNIVWYNSAARGGAIDSCQGTIQSNFIGENTATGEGGALFGCHNQIRSNIIWNNQAAQGGALSFCGRANNPQILSIIEQNTIYGNDATGTLGVGGIYNCDTVANMNRNNILWANTGSSSLQIDNSTAPINSAVGQSVDPNPGHTQNLGPASWGGNINESLIFSVDAYPLAVNTTSPRPSHHWGTFLHIEAGSKCINVGDGNALEGPDYRDIDNQIGPISNDPVDDTLLKVRRDIGADEFPTSGIGSGNPWWYQL